MNLEKLMPLELLRFYYCEASYCHPDHIETSPYEKLLTKIKKSVDITYYESNILRAAYKLKEPQNHRYDPFNSLLIKMDWQHFNALVYQTGALLHHQALRKILNPKKLLLLKEKISEEHINFAINKGMILLPASFSPNSNTDLALDKKIVHDGMRCLFTAINKAPPLRTRLMIKLSKALYSQWQAIDPSFYLDQETSKSILLKILEQNRYQ